LNITVILCTYNRSESLAKALQSVAASVMPASTQWTVLVIDNNSKDQTREVVQEFCRKYPGRFSYIFEARQGKSYALNTGVEQSPGDVLVFMDDDVEVDSEWLHNLTASLTHDEWVGAGGRILPEQGFIPERWMDIGDRYGMAPLAMFDLGVEPAELKEPPFGTNMAFRKQVFAKYGGFRTDLGPQPGTEIRSEDSEFGARLLAAGERFWYEPSAVVYHSVPRKRARRAYFQTWWFGKGRADVRELGREKARWYIAGIPLFLFRRIVVWTLRFTLCPREPQRFSNKLKIYWLAGIILEHYKQAQPMS
jgi:glucosyl-dolichyl phosphate glucuronosyltransferase